MRHTRLMLVCLLGAVVTAGMQTGCSSGDSGARPASAGGRLDLGHATNVALKAFQSDARAGRFFDSAYGWAVFPKITKGALVVGVASGRGQVFREGKLAGYAKLTAVTVGHRSAGRRFRRSSS